MSGHYGGDAFSTYLTTESIVSDRNLVLNDHPGRVFGIKEMESVYNRIIRKDAAEKIYSKYQLGQVLIQIPFFIIGLIFSGLPLGISQDYVTMFFVSMSNCFVSALLCMMFYKLLKLFYISDKISLLVTLAFGLSTFIFPFSKQGFREPLVGLCILSGVYYMLKFKNKYLILSSVFIGYAIFTRFDTLYILPLFLLYIFLVYPRKYLGGNVYHRILYFFCPIMFFVLITFAINYFVRGNIMEFGYNKVLNLNPVDFIGSIYGFFFSSGRSFFLYAPVTILFFWSIKRFIKTYSNEGIFFISIIIINILLYSIVNYHSFGGSCWGPRYNYTLIPLFLIPVGVVLDFKWDKNPSAEKDNKIFIFKGLIILGILIQLPAILVNNSLMLHSYRDYYNKKLGIYKNPPPINAFGDIEFITFMPRLSPVLWGYYQMGSAVSSSIGRESFKITTFYYDDYFSLDKIDFWDIWFMNVFRVMKK
ncbi:MAG: hypothetical protein ACTSQG_11910 [Promethearchaeota archaeon]